ncbi:MAG: polyphosphate kinase 2 family protein [Thermodesulfobacteriota bacterium]
MDRYRVKPGSKVNLKKWDPNDTSAFDLKKQDSDKILLPLNKKLEALQELLYAENQHKILIVLQAMDAGGKDGTIRQVFDGVNPQGVKIKSFIKPTLEELSHDYLWRAHKHTPSNGEMVIFNRSHYEDVLVVRVENLVSKKIWKKRYEHINSFEKMLADEGTTILKFYLNISKDEQKERFQERLDIKEKNWKFSLGDLEVRKKWDEYIKAYEDMFSKTSTEESPWYIIPSNRNWYRNLVIISILIDKLEKLNMKFPKQEEDLSNVIIK